MAAAVETKADTINVRFDIASLLLTLYSMTAGGA
jgi:hypothetical protein